MNYIYIINDKSYQIKIPYYDNDKRKFYTECFNFDKYGGKKNALEAARRKRDEIKVRLNTKRFILPSMSQKIETLEDVFELKEKLIPLDEGTNSKHRMWLKKYMNINKKFLDITSADIQESLNKMATTCSQDTINRILSVWKKCYKACQIEGIDVIDQTVRVIAPRSRHVTRKRNKKYNYTDVNELLDIVSKSSICEEDKQLIITAIKVTYALGTRPGETYALEGKDIDTDNMNVLICKWLSSDGELKVTKTPSSYRTIPYINKDRELFETLAKKKGFIFKRSNGQLMCSNIACAKLNNITGGKFRMYMLRHKMATDLIGENVDLGVVQKIMGHKSASQTLEYAEPQDTDIREAMKQRK